MKFRDLLRKPLAAAALSFVFPGLGQAAAGDRRRGAIVAIPAFALLGTVLAVAIVDRSALFGLAVDQQWLTSLLLLDLVTLIYHVWAIVDSYIVAGLAAPKKKRADAPARKWAPILGIGILLSGTVVVHGGVAKVDTDWQRALYCLTAKIPCWVSDNPVSFDPNATDIAQGSNGPGAASSGSTAPATPIPTYDLSKIATFSTTSDAQNWDADGELNVLLVGLGVDDVPSQLGPDTIMVLHTSMTTGQAELISIGRNNYCTPMPTQEIAAHYPSPPYNCPAGTWGPLLNGLPIEILGHCDRWPIPEFQSTCGQANDPNRYARAYKGFEMTIGNLLGIRIDGSMWINPIGLTTLIDAVHGVDITVQTGLFDKPCGPAGTQQQKLGSQLQVPGNATCEDTSHWGYFVPTGMSGVQKMKDAAAASGGGLVVYSVPGHDPDVAIIIAPGTYHMNGDWALAFARTRIFDAGGDYSRAARQQVLLSSLRKGLDPCKFASLDNVLPLLGAVRAVPYGFNTDMDITNPQNIKSWAGLAKSVLGENVRQLVLDPQKVGMSDSAEYVAWDANTISKARALVKDNFQSAPKTSPGSGGSTCG